MENKGEKTRKTLIERYGEDYFRNIGRKGGSACVPKGFAANPELAKEAGKKSGEARRRNNDKSRIDGIGLVDA